MVDKINESTLRSDDERKTVTGFFRSFGSSDKIYYRRSQPQNIQKDHVHLILVHDFASYHGRFNKLTNSLIKGMGDKISVTSMDLRGHGLSSGSRCYIEDFAIYCQDLASLINIREFVPSEVSNKTIILGHGLGGLIVLHLLEQYEYLVQGLVSGIIVSNPVVKLKFDPPSIGSSFLAKFLKDVTKIRVPKPFNGYDIMSETSEAESYNSDPLVPNFLTVGLINEVIASSKSVRNYSYFVDLPSLFLVSGDSVVVEKDIVTLFQKGMPKSSSRLRIFENFKHDIYHEKGQNKAIKEISDWLNLQL